MATNERHAVTPPFATHTKAFIHKLGRREKKQINKQWMEENQTSTDASERHDLSLEKQTDEEIVPRQRGGSSKHRQREKWSTLSRYCKWKSG